MRTRPLKSEMNCAWRAAHGGAGSGGYSALFVHKPNPSRGDSTSLDRCENYVLGGGLHAACVETTLRVWLYTIQIHPKITRCLLWMCYSKYAVTAGKCVRVGALDLGNKGKGVEAA
jgi:hypothetical protein